MFASTHSSPVIYMNISVERPAYICIAGHSGNRELSTMSDTVASESGPFRDGYLYSQLRSVVFIHHIFSQSAHWELC